MELIVCELKLFFEAYHIVKSLLFFANWKCSFEFPFTLIRQLNWYIPFWGAVNIPVEGLYPCLLFVLTSSNFKIALTPVSEVSFDNKAKNTGRSLWRFTLKRKKLFPKTFALFGFPIFWRLTWWRLFQNARCVLS